MAPTIELIESITLSSDTATVTFSNIPQDYDDLNVLISARSSSGNAPGGSADIIKMSMNSTAMSSVRYLWGLGSNSPSNGSATSPTGVGHLTDPNCTSNTFASVDIIIPNYTSSNNKSISSTGVSEHNGSIVPMAVWSGLYSGLTNSISSITFTTNNSANFVSGSTFELYGIKDADDGAEGRFGPAAQGGDEVFTTGDGYKVHVFKSSGTLTVTNPGEVEYLVVAGGGSGGTSTGGAGGGAGGYRSSVGGESSGGSSQTENKLKFINGTYLVTVGAGGAGDNNGAGASGSNSSLGNIISVGGGSGGGYGVSGFNGGSGGGGVGEFGGDLGGPGGDGIIGQGNNAGDGYYDSNGNLRAGAGGGGAGGPSSNAGSGSPTAGGPGLYSSITGTSTPRAGGGGGCKNQASASGGVGGGGAGGIVYVNGISGTANTGGGGGGQSGGASSGNGGSGIVIIRYKI